MFGAIAGTFATAAGALINSINQSKLAKKQRLFLEQRKKENEDIYRNSKYDHTQSAAAQYDRTQSDKAIQQAVEATNGAVTGGDLDRAKTLGKAMEARAQRDAQITANGEAQERAEKATYLQRKDSIEDAQNNLATQQAANSAAAMQGVVNAGAQLALADISSSQQTGKGLFGEGGAKVTNVNTGDSTSVFANNLTNKLAPKFNFDPNKNAQYGSFIASNTFKKLYG